MANDDEKPPIIVIKKVKKISGGHHGGAWKVAYADFVTAMMAFFLLLWLLNVTTDEQKALISSYFSPADPRVAQSMSGSGGVLGGLTMSSEGALTSQQDPVSSHPSTPAAAMGTEGAEVDVASESKSAEEVMAEKAEERSFKETADALKQALMTSPELKELAQHLLVDMTPEGLRIQIVDQEGKPMFELGRATPLPAARQLMLLIAKTVVDLPNRISVRGHTDARPYGDGAAYTNWELSSDRANASRRILIEGGLDIERIENVQGKADREHLVPDEPNSARNRRISVVLLKQSIVPGVEKPRATPGAAGSAPPPEEPSRKKREKGVIYFP